MNKTESTTEIESTTTESYMDLSFSRAPKKNHDALVQLGKQYVQWLKSQGVRTEIYHLSSSSITKTLSVGDDEELWVSLQFYRDRAHAEEVQAKMMQDESVGALMKDFDGLVTQGKNLITGGFSRLKV
jgi:uncharacterized protein YbaA (DUF1428 family)